MPLQAQVEAGRSRYREGFDESVGRQRLGARTGGEAIGALIVSVVRVGMTFMGVNVFAQQIVLGLVLIAAVWITIDRSKIPVVK